MRRRDFIKALGGGAAAWPLAARAQRMAMPVIGYLAAGNPNSERRLVDAFVKGLGQAGYEDGKNAKIEYRWAENQYDRLPSMAADLVRREVAVIAAMTNAPRYSAHWSMLNRSKMPIASRLPKNAATAAQRAMS